MVKMGRVSLMLTVTDVQLVLPDMQCLVIS